MLRGKLKLIIVFLLACLAAGGGFLAARLFFFPPVSGQETGSTDTGGSQPGTLNILLLGTDARPGEKVGNTDTIILAHFDGERLALLSIPRDTRVNIPGHGVDKINAAYSIGGPDLTTSIVADLTGVPISKYVLLRWDGFIKIIDLLGG
ncbi:Transcriptional regulator LytR [Moorella thermoacetica]|uniref:Transcriptional regulator LytR n=2 Tax=Neomoorella thermoacetica TaxID=1525 RepID=A0ABY3N8R6_NEOTH|nr:Transcriptional regulator LytR [Moorella thermoacetica]